MSIDEGVRDERVRSLEFARRGHSLCTRRSGMKSSSGVAVGLLLTASMGVGHHLNAASTRRAQSAIGQQSQTPARSAWRVPRIPTDALISRGCGSVEAPHRWSARRPSKVASSDSGGSRDAQSASATDLPRRKQRLRGRRCRVPGGAGIGAAVQEPRVDGKLGRHDRAGVRQSNIVGGRSARRPYPAADVGGASATGRRGGRPSTLPHRSRRLHPVVSLHYHRHAEAGRPLRIGHFSYYQIVQTPQHVIIEMETIHDARIIPLDGRPHLPSASRLWHGDSRGRWDGDTLVVDTTNFSSKSNFMGSGENLHLVERFTRVARTRSTQMTFDDPTVWTRPWTAMIPLKQTPGPIYEFACHEGSGLIMQAMLAAAHV